MPSIFRFLIPRVFLAAFCRARESSLLRRLFARTVLILGYHDLRGPQDLDSWLRVDIAAFREHLQLLSTIGTFIEPGQLDNLQDLPGVGPHILITFDDGYANWLRLGVPILEELRVPALFFVTSDNMLTGHPFWFDCVVLALQSNRLTRLDLREFGLADFRFRTGHPARRWDDIERVLTSIKRLGDAGSPAVDSVLRHLDDLAKSAPNGDPSLRPISVEEVREMARFGTCHFGSHGHRHDILTRLEHGPLLDSLEHSKQALESITGKPIRELAYPNGDSSDRVVQGLRESGYDRGFTTTSGVCESETDRYRIPRLLVGGYDSRRRLAGRLGEVLLRYAIGTLRRTRPD